MTVSRYLLLILTAVILAACASQSNPANTVQQYLEAKIQGDRDTLAGLLCSEMEAELDREARTFDTVSDVRIEDMDCTFDGTDRVSCTGQIVATYGTQDTDFALTTYRVVQEGGEWKWCGEG